MDREPASSSADDVDIDPNTMGLATGDRILGVHGCFFVHDGDGLSVSGINETSADKI